jgi:hypothetical protein
MVLSYIARAETIASVPSRQELVLRDSKEHRLESSILHEVNSRATYFTGSALSLHSDLSVGSHGYLQNGSDVHGSYMIFYWTRSRGKGIVVSSEGASVLLHYSQIMRRIALIRPIGISQSIVNLLNSICTVLNRISPNETVTVRYCNLNLAVLLRQEGWHDISEPLLP